MTGVSIAGSAARPRAGEPVPGTGMSLLVRGPGYEGHVVIDTIVNDQSAGGVRIAADLDLDEVRELASEMSLKYALFHLPRGGAKSGIRIPDGLGREERLAALEDFGRKLGPVIGHGIYSPGMDMNCGPEELRAIYRGAGIQLGAITDTSWFTAISVHQSVESVCAVLDTGGRPVTLAIEGFGSVARHLMDRLDPDRFRIVSIATIEGALGRAAGFSPGELAAARQAHGDSLVDALDGERADRAAVLESDVDILLPSSRVWSITPEIAERVGASAVVPIANAPYAGNAVEILHRRSVVCLPGYLSNCGGVLASSLADLGVPVARVEAAMAGSYRRIVDGILRLSAAEGRPATEVGEALARGHMPERARPVVRSLARRVYERFVAPRRPRSLRAASALRDFEDRCGRVLAEIRQQERGA